MQKLARGANIVVILLTLLAYLSPHLNPENFWTLSVLGTGFPVLLFFNIFFIVFWLSGKNKYFLFSLVCLLVGWKYVRSVVGFSMGSEAPKTATTIKVLSWNIGGWAMTNYKANKNVGFEQLNEFLTKENPDVLCLQEFNYSEKGTDKIYQIVPILTKYPYRFKELYKTQIIYSKYPILNKGALDFGQTGNGCVFTDLNVNGKTIRLYSVHLESNKITLTADRVLEQKNFEDKETWGDIRSIFGRVRRFSKIRANQVQKLRENLLSHPNPSIVCGDFNDTPLSYPYKVVSNLLEDSFVEAGFGLGTTFNGSIPLLRIDYIFTNKKFQTLDFQRFKVDFSDHFPIESVILIK